jgi:hypothetical protein
MGTADMTGLLGFGTLIIGLFIAVIIWARFMRDPKNRHPMKGERERNLGQIREEAGDQNEPTKPRSEF